MTGPGFLMDVARLPASRQARARPGTWLGAGALLWLTATAATLWWPDLPSPAWACALTLAGLAVLAGAVGARRGGCWPLAAGLSAAVGLLALAIGLTGWRAQARVADVLDPDLEGRTLSVHGRVVGLPRVDASGWHFLFDLASTPGLGSAAPVQGLPKRLSLHWVRGWHEGSLVAGPPADLRAGDLWQLPVRLKRPHAVLNPHGFDGELWLFEQGIGAMGSVQSAAAGDPVLVERARWWRPDEALGAWRQHLRDRLWLLDGDLAEPGVLAALVIGDQSAIDEAGWDRFRVTGVAHLMSISGLHITLFAWLASGLVAAAWRRAPAGLLRWPAGTAGLWGGVVLASAYAVLAGWGVPAQRTVWMLVLAVLLRTLALRWPPLLLCLVAGAGVAVADPWALLQPGYWLSFVAVALLLASGQDRPATTSGALEVVEGQGEGPGSRNRWLATAVDTLKQGLRAQWLASVGLAPLSLVLFDQLSLVGLLANLVAVPVVTFVVTPLALLGVVWSPIWSLADLALQPVLAWLDVLAAWPGAVWVAPVAPAWAQGLALLGGAMLVLPLPRPVRWAGVFLVLPLCWPKVEAPPPGRFELLALDVGQGSAVLVRTAHHLLLHDTGPRHASGSDAGRRVVLPALQARGERDVDVLVLSHRDQDHVGGAASVLAGTRVGQLLVSLESEHPLRRSGVPVLDCRAGQQWMWDGVRFEVLHPSPPGPPVGGKTARRPNARSCVVRVVDASGDSVLLTGDIEAEQESELVRRFGPALHSTVLVVPHHGSRTSSSPAFLDAVAPQWAVVQVAYRSHFGHPHPDVLRRYVERRIQVVRTDRCGAWFWGISGPMCTRDGRRHHWYREIDLPLHSGGADVARVSSAGERE